MKSLLLAAAGAASLIVAGPAAAVTFAQGSQVDTDVSTFFFTNNANGTSTISGSGRGSFLVTDDDSILNLPDFAGFDFQPSNFTFEGTSTQAAFGAGPTLQQVVDSGTLTFTSALGNLLTVNFTNGLIGGRDGGIFLWGGDDSSISATVTYTSDFETPDFSLLPDGTDNFMLALTLNPATSNLALGSNGQLASFEASTVGTFRTGVGAIPEPGTWAMMILGFGGAGAALRSRRRAMVSAV